MKILLTAHQKTGKSTVIQKFLSLYKGKVAGVFAEEIKDETGERVGFKNVNLKGDERLLMHVSEIESDVLIGKSQFRVDIDGIEQFVVPEIINGLSDSALIVIDEIGKAQSNSPLFLETVRKAIRSDNDLLATIGDSSEEWAIAFRADPSVTVMEVTLENRDAMPQILVDLFMNSDEMKLN